MVPRSSFRKFVEIFLGESVFVIVILWWNDTVPGFGFSIGRVILFDIIIICSVEFEVGIHIEDKDSIAFFEGWTVFFVRSIPVLGFFLNFGCIGDIMTMRGAFVKFNSGL